MKRHTSLFLLLYLLFSLFSYSHKPPLFFLSLSPPMLLAPLHSRIKYMPRRINLDFDANIFVPLFSTPFSFLPKGTLGLTSSVFLLLLARLPPFPLSLLPCNSLLCRYFFLYLSSFSFVFLPFLLVPQASHPHPHLSLAHLKHSM